MKNTLSEKRQKLLVLFRKEHKKSYFDSARKKMLQKIDDEQYESESQKIMMMAYQKLENEQISYLNMFANIEVIFQQNLQKPSHSFLSKISFYMYIQLTTSNQVINYMCQHNLVQEWRRMLNLLSLHPTCQEYLFQRMKILIIVYCQNNNIEIFSLYNQLDAAIMPIFTPETTQILTHISFPIDQQSQYYDLMSLYISLMPKSHIIPTINEGYVQMSINASNSSITRTYLTKLQNQPQFICFYQDLLEQIENSRFNFMRKQREDQ